MLVVRFPASDESVETLYLLAIRCGWLRENPRMKVSTKEKREAARWFIARLVDDTVNAAKR